jgi:RNA polymerase sigma-70 factor (ECF subfamily)
VERHDDDALPDDERALLDRARAGDEEAFAAIYRAYYERLCRVAYRYLRSRDAAAETVQELFLQLWRRRADREVKGELGAFLHGATRRRALDVLRRTKRRTVPLEQSEQEAMAAPEVIDERFMTLELEAALQRAIDALPPRPRQILQMRLQRQLSYRQIAEELGIAVKTVEMHLTRGLAALRLSLRPDEEER